MRRIALIILVGILVLAAGCTTQATPRTRIWFKGR